MRKITVFMHTGRCQEDAVEILEVGSDDTDEELDIYLEELVLSHAEMYGHYMCSDDCTDTTCEYDHPGSSNISGYWEEYDPKEHDALV